MKKKIGLISLLILAAVLIAACAPTTAAPAVDSQPDVEELPAQEAPAEQAPEDAPAVPLPNWYSSELTDVNTGNVFRVADFQGKVVLVETLAVWCSTCFRQQLEIKELHQQNDGRDDLVSLGIDIDPNESVSQLTGYVKENGFDWLYVLASNELINEISDLYGPQYLNPPSAPMFIIDRQGEAHLLPFGVKSAEDLMGYLQPFFDEE